MTTKIMLSYDLSVQGIQKIEIPKSSHPISIIKDVETQPKLLVMAAKVWDEEGQEHQEYDLNDKMEITLMTIRSGDVYNSNNILNYLGSYFYRHREYHVFQLKK